MIDPGHRYASRLSATALAVGLFVAGAQAHAAERAAAVPASGAAASAAASADRITVAFDDGGVERDVTTSAKTVGDFLTEAGVTPADGDYLSHPVGDSLVDGMHLTYRPAVSVTLRDGRRSRTVRSADLTVADLLTSQNVPLSRNDEVLPSPATPLADGQIVHITRVAAWTRSERSKIAPRTVKRFSSRLARGTRETVKAGRAGMRVTTVSFYERDGGRPTKTVLSSRVVRTAQPQVVVVGTGPASAFGTFARDRISGAVRFAGEALHVLATAYTASCYGCSGITATGAPAGHGVIAVDPHFIPLGTRLFIPGYGRAVAGDTGGAIVGRHVDLGFDGIADARNFGTRPIVMYIVR